MLDLDDFQLKSSPTVQAFAEEQAPEEQEVPIRIFGVVDPEGNILFTFVPSDPDIYQDGAQEFGNTYRLLPEGIPEQEAVDNLYWKEGWHLRNPRPSFDHVWDSEEESWKVDFVGRQERLRPQINNIRDQLEAGRVIVDGHLIDIDERAEKRMSDALEMWDALGVTTLPWVLGDNTTLPVDKAQLQRFYDEGRRLRALRALQLHTESRALKDNLDTTQDDIDAWAASYA